MQGSGGLEPPEPGGDDEDSVRSVTDSEQSEDEKAKWNKKALKTTLGDAVAMAHGYTSFRNSDLRHF